MAVAGTVAVEAAVGIAVVVAAAGAEAAVGIAVVVAAAAEAAARVVGQVVAAVEAVAGTAVGVAVAVEAAACRAVLVHQVRPAVVQGPGPGRVVSQGSGGLPGCKRSAMPCVSCPTAG